MSSLRIKPRKRPGRAAADMRFRAADEHREAGRWAEAERLYREVVAADPHHADALHMLGLLAYRTGRLHIAVTLVTRAIAADGREASFHNTLGAALLAGGQGEVAETAYRRALALAPDAAEVHNNLGNALLALGRLDEAIACYIAGLERAPDNTELLNNLGLALHSQGRLDTAIVHIRRALTLAPTDAMAHVNLGNVLLAQGDVAGALAACDQALLCDPDCASAHNARANVLMAIDRPAEAVVAYQRAVALAPTAVDVYCNLGVALHRCGQLADAVAVYAHAMTFAPADAELHNALGLVRKDMGDPELAAESFGSAVSLKPGFADAHNNLGNLCRDAGDFSAATAHYDRAIAAAPGFTPAALNRAALKSFVPRGADVAAPADLAAAELAAASGLDPSPIRPDIALQAHFAFGKALYDAGDDEAPLVQFEKSNPLKLGVREKFVYGDADFAALEELAAASGRNSSPIPTGLALYAHFAFGKALADVGDDDAAFDQFQKGNALKRGMFDYDGPAMTGHIRGVAGHFPKARMQTAAGETGAGIVFIVGTVRSGATLLEEILANHPEVHSVGAPAAFDRAARQVFADTGPRFDYGAHMQALTADNLARLAETYRALAPLPPGKSMLVDRLPENALNIGLIRLALPGARIVHAVRDPVETCVSCFTTLFRQGHPYAYDLAELGDYYAAYAGLMAHWREMLPQDAMLEVRYEALLSDFKAEAQRLMDHCGLTRDGQVRRPSFAATTAHGQRYAAHLGPLLAALG